MYFVEPIRDPEALARIERSLRHRKDPRNHLLFVLGVTTPLHGTELLSLRLRDMVDASGTVAREISIHTGKNARLTSVRLTDSARNAVRRYMRRHREVGRNASLFPSRGGAEALGCWQLWALVNQWCARAGIPGRHGAQTLRKTWGYQAYRHHGMPLGAVQRALGHARPGITRRYLGLPPERHGRKG